MNNPVYSTMLRAGKTTFFVDVKETKTGKKYLSISSTTIEGEERKRSTIRVFGEAVEQFKLAINEAVAAAQ